MTRVLVNIVVPTLAVAAAALLGFTIWNIFVVTPMEQELFYSQKIFYYHVPNAFMLFLAVGVCGVASVAFLKTRQPRWDDLGVASAEMAVLFGAIVLVTGSIWARAAWSTWWVWEPRLVTSLLLWLIMVGYVLVRRFAGIGSERIGAGLAIFGTVGIPLIYKGVSAGDRHPQAKVVQTLDSTMQLTFWLSVLTFFLVFLAFVIVRVQNARAERQLREIHERGLDTGLLDA
jgi:heme exporter protein C